MKARVYRFPLHIDSEKAQRDVADLERKVKPRIRAWRWKRRAVMVVDFFGHWPAFSWALLVVAGCGLMVVLHLALTGGWR